METIVVIDFETTGLSPGQGARATEIAAVVVEDGKIVDRYDSLMNAGVVVPAFIEALTGISTEMVRAAPPVERVMREVAEFVGGRPLLAHNAGFDRKFWVAEMARAGRPHAHEFLCTLRLGRRIYPDAPNHKLATLARHAGVPVVGHHRALPDAEMTAGVFVHMERELRERFGLARVSHELLWALQKSSVRAAEACVSRFVERAAQ